MPAKTRLAQLIAQEEGFGLKGAIPTNRHNPGDLRHSPHSQHPGGPIHANDVGTIDSDDDGWADLERQLEIYATWGLDLQQMVNVYLGLPVNTPASAADVDGNNRARYLAFVCEGLGLGPGVSVTTALLIPAQEQL